MLIPFFNQYFLQVETVSECTYSYAGDILRDHNALQATAHVERIIPDTGDIVRDIDAGQADAAKEHIITYTGDVLRNPDIRQAAAAGQHTMS